MTTNNRRKNNVKTDDAAILGKTANKGPDLPGLYEKFYVKRNNIMRLITLKNENLPEVLNLFVECFAHDKYYERMLGETTSITMREKFEADIAYLIGEGDSVGVVDNNGTIIAFLLAFDYFKTKTTNAANFYRLFEATDEKSLPYNEKLHKPIINGGRETLFLVLIAVKNEYRRLGIGSGLIDYYCRKYSEYNLTGDVSNTESLKIYSDRGFTINNIDDDYYLIYRKKRTLEDNNEEKSEEFREIATENIATYDINENTPLGVVRHYQGEEDINYLLTLRDFKEKLFACKPCEDTFSAHDPDKDWALFVNALKTGGVAEWRLGSDDTMFVMILSDHTLATFLAGGYNEDMVEYVRNNFDNGKDFDNSLQGCVDTAIHWCWALEAEDSSSELIAWARKTYPLLFKKSLYDHFCNRQDIADLLRDRLSDDEYKRLEEYLGL